MNPMRENVRNATLTAVQLACQLSIAPSVVWAVRASTEAQQTPPVGRELHWHLMDDYYWAEDNLVS